VGGQLTTEDRGQVEHRCRAILENGGEHIVGDLDPELDPVGGSRISATECDR